MIYITGDTHGTIDIHKLNSKNFQVQKEMTKSDYVIICGDFGLVWSDNSEEMWWRKWLDKKPFTTLFVDGNHENHLLLDSYPVIEKWGGRVGVISDSVFHLKRGEVYRIDGKNIYTFGGAYSVDREFRVLGKSWWNEEIASQEEMAYGIENMKNSASELDLIITHTCPSSQFEHLEVRGKIVTEMDEYLERLRYILERSGNRHYHWYFGHFHADDSIGQRYTAIYRDVIKVN